MLASVSKSFTFDAAHQLPNHDGKCARPHGHTYKLEVSVYGWIRPADGATDEGMVIDFGEIKEVFRKHVEPLVDHQDLNETLRGKLPDSNGIPITTAEHIGEWLHGVFCEQLGQQSTAVTIRLWETPTSYVRVGQA